jgi:hypothetical protein
MPKSLDMSVRTNIVVVYNLFSAFLWTRCKKSASKQLSNTNKNTFIIKVLLVVLDGYFLNG